MKNFLKNISVFNLLVILMFGFSFYFFIDYLEERFAIIEKSSKNYDKKLVELENKYQNQLKENQLKFSEIDTILLSLIQSEQKRDENFRNEIDKVLNDLTRLNKIVTTDKELLRKYSKVYFLNEHYSPLSLVEIDKEFVSKTSNNFKIHRSVSSYLFGLLQEAKNASLSLQVQSAYRSFEDQMRLKSGNTVIYGTGANKFSADQGYSEHQLGTTVDFTTGNTAGKLSGFDNTAEYTWLLNNAHRYGFVLSYPKGNEYYIFEPWHWRFVGVRLASRLYEEKKYFYDMDQREIDTYLVNLFD